ncbi:MAG: hypothetical protein Q9199_000566 [Rusavskia elegans]
MASLRQISPQSIKFMQFLPSHPQGFSTVIYAPKPAEREKLRALHTLTVNVGRIKSGTPHSERAMKVLDPRIHAAFKRVTVQNGTDWFTWMDDFTQGSCVAQSDGEKLIHKMYLGERGFEGCHRADFLDELIKMMLKDTIQFCKSLDAIDDLRRTERMAAPQIRM